jgi:nitrogenase molybdenum-iron protein alpha chain
MVGFEDWLRSLARILGQEVAAEHYLCEQREKYLPRIEALREHLRGRRAVVGMGPSYAFNFTRVLGELGVEVDRTFAWHLDPLYDHGQKPESIAWLAKHRPHQEVRVSDLQYHELVHELRRVRPDIYFFRHPTNAGIIQKLGIPAFSVISEGCAFGYRGLWEFGQAISDTLANRNFERRLAAKTRLPFTSAWLEGPQAVVLDEDPFLKPELLEAV